MLSTDDCRAWRTVYAIMRDDAMAQARRAALLDHELTGDPIVVWENGRVVWIPADQIEVDDATARSR